MTESVDGSVGNSNAKLQRLRQSITSPPTVWLDE